ncbi:sulfite exporter TauE/SafE family protein [Dehalogenimonas etheniformans]|nr:sulfite exporter TauE/SafE family protein [Dehalogenimonas etheniformans]
MSPLMGESIINGAWVLPALLALVGLVVGAYGTLIGVGGALVLVPLLLLLYPHATPQAITAISLVIVLVNSVGGTIAYARQKRVDYRNGLIFAFGTVPGVLLGIWTLQYVSRNLFALIFGIVMIAISAFLIIRAEPANTAKSVNGHYSCNRPLGFTLSMVAGYLAGLLGIGGGIIHVPVMVYIMCFPTHVATATSHFILIFTGATGTLTHLGQGTFGSDWSVIIWLALGVVLGSQIGARLSKRVHGNVLIRLLAVALAITGLRLVLG